MPRSKSDHRTGRLFRNASGQEQLFEKSYEEEFEARRGQPVECLGMTFENDEARRAHFLGKLKEGLEELHAKLGGVPFTSVADAVTRMVAIEHWSMGDEARLRDLAERMRHAESSKDLLQRWKEEVGFPHGEIEDILNLSDPPYYTACPNPFLGSLIREIGSPYDPTSGDYHREPFAADVTEGKRDSLYEHISYHTKVPHKAVATYIAHYTNPRDIILDGFSGSGMTGLAAKYLSSLKTHPSGPVGERHVILDDLSPYATFIGHHFNSKASIKDLNEEFDNFSEDYAWMYETCHTDGSVRQINYTVWSDVFSCPECGSEVVFFDHFVDELTGGVKENANCHSCNARITKRLLQSAWVTYFDDLLGKTLTVLKQKPVLIKYFIGSKQLEKKPDENDLENIQNVSKTSLPAWVPIFELVKGDNTKQPINSHGVRYSHMFFTRRNLIALSGLWDIAKKANDTFWMFELLGCFRVWTRRSIFLTKAWKTGGTGAFKPSTSGILYMPSISGERNVLLSFKERRDKALNFSRNLPKSHIPSLSSTGSATYLGSILSNTVDYIFVDPPFGGNIMYSELNSVFEPWLRVTTRSANEVICNKAQKKSIELYTELMTSSFSEMWRVLKPGRWITVEFHNSKNSIWNSIQESLQRASFIVADVRTLDKMQGTFKQYTSVNIAKQDLVISAYKPNMELEGRFEIAAGSEAGVWDFMRTHLGQLPVFVSRDGQAEVLSERQNYLLFDRMVAFHVQRGVTVPMSAAEFYAGLAQRFPERDGMYFLPNQVAQYDKKRMTVKEVLQLEIFVIDEASAIQWLKQQLSRKPQTFKDIQPQFLREIGGWQKHERALELSEVLEQNFLCYDGTGEVPSQIHGYLSTNFKELRKLPKDHPGLRSKAKDRWYVPDPNKAGDLEKLRERALLREFEEYRESTQKRLKVFRLEAVRAGFKRAWQDRNYKTIIAVARKVPENVLQEDPKLLMWYDQALTRTGGDA